MQRTNVTSSNIKSIGYDDRTSTLEIEFLDYSVYQYFDVPQNIYKGIKEAPSHGKYLANHIKGHYRYSKI